ncbi:SusC/RagA family TonB-linked outer membrane protein [Galbibacter sp. EGI 63066]|uniref:SusC/RagA family TonB-linked outer membrane protein n=1 Tax=Galbibacter sp. EGI 63066 TaxID=2993559 RepID=UPI002248C21A|nr:SusC/RagA family TonB-linked outer membrane protein [Galbibacter sp. EGI 63066]MCX2680973.1 SusC/RagA family TonB-linked outer membrane protein [Galbibacter sp. EGI 63066]
MKKNHSKKGETCLYPSGRNWQHFVTKIMRWTFLITCILCLSAFTLPVESVSGQPLLERKVSVDVQNSSLKQILDKLSETSGVPIMYGGRIAKDPARIDFRVKQKTLKQALDKLLDSRPYDYQVMGDEIIIRNQPEPKENLNDPEPRQGQQPGTLGGVVTDTLGLPLPGVAVYIKATSRGTITDTEGKYELQNVAPDATVVFRMIGFQTREVPVEGKEVINVVLQEETTKLTEVVVNAGYWEVKDRERTGNISRVTAKEIERQSINNPLAALHGRMPGVYIEQNSGLPGGGFDIQIRGRNSLRSDANNPLYIIDGVPFPSTSLSTTAISQQIILSPSPLATLNPTNIQSIEILKDADATAIYGSRGANGVVLITTKKGAPGKTKVEVNISTGAGQVADMLKLLNTEQYIEMRTEAFANDGITPTVANARDLLLWDTTRYTDWQKVLIGGTAYTNNAQLSVSGGNKNTQFLFRGGYYRETTVFPGDQAYQRGSGQFNLNHTSENRKFGINLTTTFSTDDNNLIANDLAIQARELPPNAPALYDEEGNLNWENSTWTNPLAFLERKYQSNTQNLIANAMFRYELFHGFQLKTSLGYSTVQMKELATTPRKSLAPASPSPSRAQFSNNRVRTWIVEPKVEYRNNIAKGELNVLLGITFQDSFNEEQFIQGNGFSNDALIESPQAATTVTTFRNYTQYRYNALFGRIHYNWKGKYLLNLTGRRDGSSRFGPGKRFGNFGAIGAAWIFSEEPFIKDHLSFVSFGKLRSSYGTTGSDQIGDYQFMDTHNSTLKLYQGPGLVPSRLVNPDYAWEVTKKLEAALELGFLQDRVFLAGSWYRNRSGNQLVGLPLPGITGFSSVQFNLPAMVQNTGWELELRTTNIQTRNFSWATNLNATLPRNKLVEYPDIENSQYANLYVVGEPLTIRKTSKFVGVDSQTGLYVVANEEGTEYSSNGLIPTTERDFATFLGQKAFGGIQNTFTFKNIELDIFFQWVKRQGGSHLGFFPRAGQLGNQPVSVMDRWQTPGDITDTQRFGTTITTLFPFLNRSSSDQVLTDTSFIRLKNVSLSWNIPDALSDQLKLQQGRIYIQGQNLLTLSKTETDFDPESRTNRMPPLQMITMGIQFTF